MIECFGSEETMRRSFHRLIDITPQGYLHSLRLLNVNY
jgi:methylphosphotriester-DNA--protein-cysteine methyltransferase